MQIMRVHVAPRPIGLEHDREVVLEVVRAQDGVLPARLPVGSGAQRSAFDALCPAALL